MSERRQALILVVDDTKDAREICAEYLGFHGYQVETAVDGWDAIEKTLALHPDLILMDLSMPSMDGWQATRWLKANQLVASIPVIAFTAHAMASSQESARAAGCDAVVTKPVLPNELVRVIQSFLPWTSPEEVCAG